MPRIIFSVCVCLYYTWYVRLYQVLRPRLFVHRAQRTRHQGQAPGVLCTHKYLMTDNASSRRDLVPLRVVESSSR